MITKWLPEIGAAVGSALIAYYTGMPILAWLVLWACMDLMSFSGSTITELLARGTQK